MLAGGNRTVTGTAAGLSAGAAVIRITTGMYFTAVCGIFIAVSVERFTMRGNTGADITPPGHIGIGGTGSPAGTTVLRVRRCIRTDSSAGGLVTGTGRQLDRECGSHTRCLDNLLHRCHRLLQDRHLARGRADQVCSEPELGNEDHGKNNYRDCNHNMHCVHLRKAGLLFLSRIGFLFISHNIHLSAHDTNSVMKCL